MRGHQLTCSYREAQLSQCRSALCAEAPAPASGRGRVALRRALIGHQGEDLQGVVELERRQLGRGEEDHRELADLEGPAEAGVRMALDRHERMFARVAGGSRHCVAGMTAMRSRPGLRSSFPRPGRRRSTAHASESRTASRELHTTDTDRSAPTRQVEADHAAWGQPHRGIGRRDLRREISGTHIASPPVVVAVPAPPLYATASTTAEAPREPVRASYVPSGRADQGAPRRPGGPWSRSDDGSRTHGRLVEDALEGFQVVVGGEHPLGRQRAERAVLLGDCLIQDLGGP